MDFQNQGSPHNSSSEKLKKQNQKQISSASRMINEENDENLKIKNKDSK